MDRRKYLATVSATVSGVALAGCSGDGDDGDGDDDNDSTPTSTNEDGGAESDNENSNSEESNSNSVTQTGRIGYQNWLPTQEALGVESMYRVTGINLDAIQENKSNLITSTYDTVKRLPELIAPTGVPFDKISEILAYPNVNIAQVAVSEQEIIESLSENNFREDGTKGEFSIYSNSSSERRAAVNGSTIIMNSTEVFSYDGVNLAIDTKQGATSRLVEQQESATELTNNFTNWTVLSIGLGGSEDALISGNTIFIEGETSTVNAVDVFDSASDVPQDRLESQVAEATQQDGVTDGQLQINGRVTVVELTAKTESDYISQGIRTLIT